MPRLLLTALMAALVVALLSVAARSLVRTGRDMRARMAATPMGPKHLGDTPMQRLSFVLLVALILYAAIWGAG